MSALANAADKSIRVYLTGGATAVLVGWREATVDIDMQIVPEDDHALRALPALKEKININVELASPSDFIPEPPGWEGRSKFITQLGKVSFFHYDFYAQALSKIERFHERDIHDVKEMLHRNLIEPERLRELFEAIAPSLYKFPAIDPKAFRKNLDSVLSGSDAPMEVGS